MRPAWRLLGALALGAVVYFYGATSEVAWLFLFGFLVWGVAAAMFAYARWNARGLSGGLRLLDVLPSALSPVGEIPERDFRDAPLPAPVFEGDLVRLELSLATAGGRARGPARFSLGVGETGLEAGTGVVPAAGWRALRDLGPLKRGPLAAKWLAIESSDPLGLFRHRRRLPAEGIAVALPLFTSLSDNRHLREVAGLSERQLVADRKPLVRAIQEPAGAGRRGVQIGERGDELGVPRGLDDLRERDAARLEPLGID